MMPPTITPMAARVASPRVGGAGAVQRVLRNSTFNLVGQGLNAVCNLLVLFALARCVARETLGLFYLLVAVITALQLVLELGVTTVLTCRIAQRPEAWRTVTAEAAGLMTL